VSVYLYLLRYTFRVRRAPQINLGRPETYRASGRLVISLLQGHIRVMSDQKKKKNKKNVRHAKLTKGSINRSGTVAKITIGFTHVSGVYL